MSIKNETIEVRRCDFCISTKDAKACHNCTKDACSACGLIYKLVSEYWNPNPYVLTLGRQGREEFGAFICNDCAQNELPAIMFRFGFVQNATSTASTG